MSCVPHATVNAPGLPYQVLGSSRAGFSSYDVPSFPAATLSVRHHGEVMWTGCGSTAGHGEVQKFNAVDLIWNN